MDEYISHSGIRGMKWGQRNGPPYPLRPGDHSAAEVKANPSLAKSVGKEGSVQKTKVKMHISPRRYTNEELKDNIERLKREEEYRRLTGQITRQQLSDIHNMVARNLLGVMTNELPKGAIEVGKEFYKVSKTFWMKLALATSPEIARFFTASANAASKVNGNSKDNGKNDDNKDSSDSSEDAFTKDSPVLTWRQKRRYGLNGKTLDKASDDERWLV